MMPRSGRAAGVAAGVLLASSLLGQASCRSGPTLPDTLSDDQFWNLAVGLSEPAGTFTHSDNLVSNEIHVVYTAPALAASGGAYIGVGPEQNLTYIAALRPAMAFVVDVRAENRSLHLLYKALFEISRDRREFVSHLFSRELPADLGPGGPVQELFARCAAAKAEHRLREETGRLVRERLVSGRKFPLSPRDLEWMDYALDAFYSDGPDIHYARTLPRDAPGPSYRTLMTSSDVFGERGSYLASDETFAFVKDLHARNLIVPVVGDFGGPTTLRRIAEYVRQHGDVATAFYGSNVEVYLNREKTAAFCANLATLPYAWNAWFIGSKGRQPLRAKLATCGT